MSRYFMSAYDVEDALYRIRKAEIRTAPETTIGDHTASAPDHRVQVQGLKDFCRRIVCVSQSTELANPRSHHSAIR